MSFGAQHWLWALFLVPVFFLVFIWAEQRASRRLQDFVSARLLPQLAGRVDRARRAFRFLLQLLAFALAVIALAQPRWGYVYEDVKRKGIDLLIAVDTSRSMLSNDVQPSRLERVKLATQDLIDQLQGDRIGLIAFAGRAFVQAPLTIDYDAVLESIHDLDTKTIPEGGTNISEAIMLAERTYGKSATGNRALVIFTDGEELNGDAVKTAKDAADAGVKIFAVGTGTPQGSLIPVPGEDGGTAFVKDSKGQVVKSKLDETRLRQIAEVTGGFYLHLDNGPRTMQQLFSEGIAKMQAQEIDARLSRRPIERYEWPLAGAILVLASSILIGERKRVRQKLHAPVVAQLATTAALALLFASAPSSPAAAPGLNAYHGGKFNDAYQEFQQTLKQYPDTSVTDKLQFDSGAAAYKMKDYGKALESFSQALLSKDTGLQGKTHYNLGNTLYERGEDQQADDKKLTDWTNALQHYEQTLKIDPENKEAKDNYEYVKKKIEELKKKQQQKPPPSPSPSPKQDKKDKKDKSDQQQQQQQQQEQQNQQQNQQNQQQQQSQSQNQPGNGQNQKPDNKQDQSQAKNEQQKKEPPKPGETPSPSPGKQPQKDQPTPSPSPGQGTGQTPTPSPGQNQAEESPTPGQGEDEKPSPSPGEGEGSEGEQASPTPAESPKKKFAGDIKGANGDKPEKPEQQGEAAEAEPEKEGQMSEKQAQLLLQSLKDEEARVQLDERKASRRVYNDW